MRKTIIMLIVSILLFVSDASCLAIEGYVNLDIGLLTEDSSAEIAIWETFGKIKIGASLNTFIAAWRPKNLIPSGCPKSLLYDLYISYDVTPNLTVSVSDNCLHYFDHYPGDKADAENLSLRFKYSF